MSYEQHDGLVASKPLGIIGKSLDLRSQTRDVETGEYRNYLSTGEVLTVLSGSSPSHTAEIRSGGFLIFVDTAPGVTTIYCFLNGTANEDLQPLIPDVINSSLNEGAAFDAS